MDLKDRKLKILHAIIQDYIATAEPVGSRTIAKNYNLGISPATVRNEMADLGVRVFGAATYLIWKDSSDKAYRLYVDQLMRVQRINKVIERTISEEFESHVGELEKIISVLPKYYLNLQTIQP